MIYDVSFGGIDWLKIFYYGVPLMMLVIIIMLGVIIGIIKNRE